MPASIYERAKQGKGRILRQPIEKEIGGRFFVFTKRELEKVWEETSCKNIGRFIREEIQEKARMSKRLAKQECLRFLIEADTFEARESENRQLRDMPT